MKIWDKVEILCQNVTSDCSTHQRKEQSDTNVEDILLLASFAVF